MSLVVLLGILIIGGLVAWLSERVNSDYPRWVSLITIALALLQLLNVVNSAPATLADPLLPTSNTNEWLVYLKLEWIPRFGISVELAMDGVSLLLLALTLLLGLIAVSSSWDEIDFKPGLFQANLMWTLAGVTGVFLAMDLFLFFLFWEVMLLSLIHI